VTKSERIPGEIAAEIAGKIGGEIPEEIPREIEGKIGLEIPQEIWSSPSFVDRQLSGSMLSFVLDRAQIA
jgi:hypothetical protein